MNPLLPEPSSANGTATTPPPPGATTAPAGWLQRVLACNPFYLLSAALLLYGIYRISVDPAFLPGEGGQLAFNFTALQLYEGLLVLTAILLARRALGYDATLLATLDAALLVVPFILVSHAALIEAGWVWGFCAAGLVLALARMEALRRWFPTLNLPPRLLTVGALTLLANAALPVVYRLLHENKVGTLPDYGAAYHTNEWVWLAGAPLIAALTAWLPTPHPRNPLIPGRRWLPEFCFGLVLAATGVHLWSLGYVYDFPVRRELVAPALWVLAWVARVRVRSYVPNPTDPAHLVAGVLPALVPLVPLSGEGNAIALTLAAAAALMYGTLAIRGYRVRLHLGLALGSVVLAVVSWPGEMGVPGLPELVGPRRWTGGLLLLAFVTAGCSRHPLAGMAGALSACLCTGLVPGLDSPALWQAQAAFVVLLLHSLGWARYPEAELQLLRGATAVGWVLVSAGFHLAGAAGWTLSLPGLGVAVVALAIRWWTRSAPVAVVLGAAALVSAMAPVAGACRLVASAPGGLLAMVGSLVLFAAGTALAFTRNLWQHQTSASDRR